MTPNQPPMADKSVTPDAASDGTVNTPAQPAATTPPTPPKRSPGHRGADVKDTVAEMTAKAHEISLEAGSKMAGAMKDVINAAAGITGFVLESARDLVQYMVRRGQMTQEEADKLIRQAEEAQVGRPAFAHPSKGAAEQDVAVAVTVEAVATESAPAKPAAKTAAAKKAPPEKPAEKAPAARSAPAKPAMAKKTVAPPAKKAAPPAASATKKAPAKSAPKKATAKRK